MGRGLLDGKVVLISAVGPGLGRQTALKAASEGAKLVLGARTESRLRELVREIGDLGGVAVYQRCDVSSKEECDALVARAEGEFGGLDVYISSGYTGSLRTTIEETDLEDWRWSFEVNLYGPLRIAQAAIPLMRRRGGGSIVLIGSAIVRHVRVGFGNYAASKAALLSAGHVLAKEVGPDNIRVNMLMPGSMQGPTISQRFATFAAESGRTVEEVWKEWTAEFALPDMPTDEETARAVIFFASDMSATMTGQAVLASGGVTFQ